MLSNQHFYHYTTRKMVITFGNLFNNIALVKYDTDTGEELERVKVPIAYGPKEKWIQRLADPDLQRETQVSLPRLSFEITGWAHDTKRNQQPLLRSGRANTATNIAAQYMGTPYNLNFELNLYARNIDDGTQIIEQILPYFNPDYTVTVTLIPQIGFQKDVPIVLDSVSNSIQFEGNFDSIRTVMWTLNFTARTYYYGPVSTPKIIRKVITNIYNDPKLQAGYVVRINTDQGNNGTYSIDDTVFQGNNYTTASAFGTVLGWNAGTAKLSIGGAQGQFEVGKIVKAVSTNASYRIASFDATPLKLAKIVIEPDPIDAEPDDDFGYDTTITEFPNIGD